jgi:glycosyltransferase involved in cell wall biosynthesis
VLIPSDVFDFVANFVDGYCKLGFDVTVGRLNFDLECGEYDIVHLLWPEEFTDWRVPTPIQIEAILARLDRWARRAPLIMSVNNLYPHRHHKNPLFHRLYDGFYMRAAVIHHFSQFSRDQVCCEYPMAIERNHIVRLGFNYERLLPRHGRNRAAARKTYGFELDQTVFMVMGTLRFWKEVELLRAAFARVRLPGKQLLLAAHYVEDGPTWQQRVRRWQWERWRRSDGVRVLAERVADEDLADLFDAADVVVVIRQNSMSSGVPSMAMTFGRFVIAPNYGAMAEYLEGTENCLYDQNSADDLARAMELAAVADRDRIGQENARIAAGWGWEGIVRACRDALPPVRFEQQLGSG